MQHPFELVFKRSGKAHDIKLPPGMKIKQTLTIQIIIILK